MARLSMNIQYSTTNTATKAMKIIVGSALIPWKTLSESQPQIIVPGIAANSYAEYDQPMDLMSIPFSVSRVGAQSRHPYRTMYTKALAIAMYQRNLLLRTYLKKMSFVERVCSCSSE